MNPAAIRFIEEISLNAWPALHSLLSDGWVLRFAEGYTRRANSVNPLYPGQIGLEEKLRFCEDMYHQQGLPVVFKLSPAVYPPALDAFLDERGYRCEAHTSVQTLTLDQGLSRIELADPSTQLLLQEHFSETWLDDYCRLSGYLEGRKDIIRSLLQRILPDHCYASIQQDGQTLACGLSVVQEGWGGLFDIVTQAEQRRRGLGRRIVVGLLDWGQQHGARQAYLQVMLDNPPALRLYEKLGFQEAYRYWYRVCQ